MDLVEAITSRRTARRYQDLEVPRHVVERLIELATHAPSACNFRRWRFILVDRRDDLQWLYDQGSASFVKDVRQALLVCYSNRNDNREWHDAEQSAAAAIAYFQLLAHAEGIGSCWICHLPPKREVRHHFEIPDFFSPVALVSFGYYDTARQLARRVDPAAAILCHSKWAFPTSPEPLLDRLHFVMRRWGRFFYYLLPGRKSLRKHVDRFEKKFPDK